MATSRFSDLNECEKESTVTTPSTPAIQARGLRKSYGKKLVLDGIDLDIPTGSTFALLGPNGAGKTTMVHILSTLLPADGGTATIGGFDVRRQADRVRGLIGLTGQFAAVDGLLSGEQNLVLMGRLRHLGAAASRRRAKALLEQFDLVEAAAKPAVTYSGGMRRRLDLAMTLVGDPRVIFLDEPTTGLDPRSRNTMWRITRELVAGGVTIVLTTQYLEEADELADTIAVLDHGRIVAEGTPTELKKRVSGGHIRLQFSSADALAAAARAIAGGVRDEEAVALDVPSDGGVAALRALLYQLEQQRIEVNDLSIHTPDLNDVFLALTGSPTSQK
jgi:ABC-2 type transport system ATP-binding protein